jgi:hypothetical protein
MNPYKSQNISKSRDAFWINQKDLAATYNWDFQNYSEKITTLDPEKGQYDSQAFEKKIICKSYDPYHDDFITLNAVAYNINKNGLIFITNQPLEVGDPIFIKAKNLFREPLNNELDEGVHAKVIWCRKILDPKHDLC